MYMELFQDIEKLGVGGTESLTGPANLVDASASSIRRLHCSDGSLSSMRASEVCVLQMTHFAIVVDVVLNNNINNNKHK